MKRTERDELIEVANQIDEAIRELCYISQATPTLSKCRTRATSALQFLQAAEDRLRKIGVPVVENLE